MPTLTPTLSRWLSRYYLGPDHIAKLRLLKGFFRISGLRLKVPYGNGGWITLDPRDGVQDSILRYGHYEPEVWEALESVARDGDVFWDVGSNIGGVAIRAALDKRIRQVHCFEPHPSIYRVLLSNIRCNPGLALRAHPLALSDREEHRTLYSPERNNCGASSLRSERKSRHSFSISCTTVDAVIGGGLAEPPHLVKVDVEGWELPVVKGAQHLLENTPPRAWVIETRADTEGRLDLPDLSRFLAAYGYRFERIPRKTGAIERVENYLFLRDVPA